MRTQPGQLDRALADMTIGVHQGRQHRHRTLADTRTGEYEQQAHVPLTGNARGWAFVDSKVGWEWPFLYAPAQRLVPFPTPHFTYGIEMVQAGDLVVITAHVEDWDINDQGWYMGATVRFASTAPLAGAAVPFSAIAHLSFQGWATYAEGDEFSP